ncbi:MAG: hypothetical protein QG632_798 [Candidatus Dependentiae bacterium]|nr:hypothetical protein [Candidatus Dependentiae bacterium]
MMRALFSSDKLAPASMRSAATRSVSAVVPGTLKLSVSHMMPNSNMLAMSGVMVRFHALNKW